MKESRNVFKDQLQYGNRIKELGLTQKFVSNQLTMSQSVLSMYLTGTLSMPTYIRAKLDKFLYKYEKL